MENKDVINYKIINVTFFVFIIYLLYKLNLLYKIKSFLLLIFISLILSYIVYPIYKKMSEKINKYLSVILIYTFIGLFVCALVFLFIPSNNFILKISDLFSNIISFVNKLSNKYNLNIDINLYVDIITKYVINNSIYFIQNVINFITKMMFVILLSICILFNINYIKRFISKSKYYILICNINEKLKAYVVANLKIIIIQFFEYLIFFFIIGHPNYLLLAILNSINSFVPIIGGIFTNFIALITASVISKKLFILTAIISIILPNIDSYIISPRIYKNTNRLSQTLSISSVIISSILFGFYGIIIAIPLLIVIIEIIKYKNDSKIKQNVL